MAVGVCRFGWCRLWWVVVAAAGGVAGLGEPGQESLQGLAFEGFPAGEGAGLQVLLEVGQGFALVAFDGRGDRPDGRGEVR